MPPASSPVSSDLQAVLNASGTMIIATDLHGIVQIFNPAAERLLGWSEAEVIGRHMPTLWHDADEIASRAAELSNELGRTVLPGFEVFVAKVRDQLNEHRQWTFVRKDGSRVVIQLVVSALRDSAGTITGYLGTGQDLTARVEAEDERDRFFNLSLDLLCIANVDGYLKRVNPSFHRVLGWTEEELLSRPFFEFIHPDDHAASTSELEKLKVGGVTLGFVNRFSCRDGSWRWISWTCTPQPDGSLCAAGRDVTDLKLAEGALSQTQQNLAITLRSIGDAVMTTDAQRRITQMNPVAEQLTGWTEADARGRSIEEVFNIVNEQTRAPAIIPVDDVLATGIVRKLANHTLLISRDGTERPIADSAAPMRDDTEQITGVVLVFRDVADERRHEQELERVNEDLERRVAKRTKELEESERFNRSTLDSLSAHLAVLDATGKIVATNLAWKKFAGSNGTAWRAVSEETNYLAVCDQAAASGDADAAATAQAIRQAIAGNRDTWTYEYPCHSPTKKRWFYCRVTRFPAGGAVRVVVAHENITAMKQAQEELAVNLAKFETLSRVSPVGIILFDAEGKCTDVNKRWCEMTGLQREHALGDGWHSAIHPEDQAQVLRRWNAMLQDGESFRTEHRLRPHNGHTGWVIGQTERITNSRGEVTGYVRTLTEITQQKQTERALRLLSTEVSKLTGAVFYEAVARHLAELVECEITAVCSPVPGETDRMATLALYEDGSTQLNLNYAVAGSPAQDIMNRGGCIVAQQVQQQYPEDTFFVEKKVESYVGVPMIASTGRHLGHLVAMSRRPLRHPERVEGILKLFALSVVAEMEQQTTQRRLSDLFEFSPDAIVIADRDGVILKANRQVATVFGWAPDALVGQPIEVLVPVDGIPGQPSLRERFVQSTAPTVMGDGRTELHGLRKDGNQFPIDISLIPMQTPEGLLIAAAFRDVTERHRFDLALREAKAFADTVVENVSGLFFVLDQEGTLVRWNQSLQNLLGLSAKQMKQTNLLSVVHEMDRQRVAGTIAKVFSDGHAADEACLSFQDGPRYFLLSGSRVEINGEVYLVGSGADITGRIQAEQDIQRLNQTLEQRVRDRTAELTTANERLIQTSRFKSEFLASMSHELRTPLNGVLGMNELLLKTPLTDKQREFIDASSTSGRALLGLINDVLDISKIESGKIELELRDCDLEALAYDAIKMFSHRAKQTGVALSCRLDPESCVTVMCDDNRLRQMLVNLLGNALKFTAKGSVVLESQCMHRDEQRIVVRVAVTDTGLGIPEDKIGRLFTPFSQVDSSTSRQFGGTGLGLSITKQLAELMGGTIGVTSRLGVGSTFWVEIPFDLVKSDVSNARRRQLLLGTRVLAVDGVDKERRQIADCLEAWGCPFEHVGTLHEAVTAVSQAEAAGRPFAVILADCRLAIGDEFVHLQNLARRPDVPVIGLGIGEGNDLATHLRQLGLRHLLRDPVRPSVLFNALTSVLSVTPPPASLSQRTDAAAEEQGMQFSGHILVAEDNHINQLYVRELLKYCGCTYDVANNGDEALLALQNRRYDLVLMDCQMPEMDGFSATREIRRREAAGELTGRLPIIALTANALKGDRERCLEAGMDDYLSKPLQVARLQATLAKYLGQTSPPPTPPGEEA